MKQRRAQSLAPAASSASSATSKPLRRLVAGWPTLHEMLYRTFVILPLVTIAWTFIFARRGVARLLGEKSDDDDGDADTGGVGVGGNSGGGGGGNTTEKETAETTTSTSSEWTGRWPANVYNHNVRETETTNLEVASLNGKQRLIHTCLHPTNALLSSLTRIYGSLLCCCILKDACDRTLFVWRLRTTQNCICVLIHNCCCTLQHVSDRFYAVRQAITETTQKLHMHPRTLFLLHH
jgi:hypothetical protein